MDEIAELEQRLGAALDRTLRALDRRPGAPSAARGDAGADPKAVEALQAQVDEERVVVAQLQARLQSVKEKEALWKSELQGQVERLTRQLDTQGLELQRMRKTAVQLREQLRDMREAQDVDAHLVNRAMLTELEALRAARQTETAELDEVIGALEPLLKEALPDA